MRALLLSPGNRTARISPIANKSLIYASSGTPVLRTRRLALAPASWHNIQRSTYYFDASHQSVKTLRVLLAECKSDANRLGQHSPSQLLAHSFDVLLNSIRPGLDDDGDSRDYFLSLLRMHLSGLSAPELQDLVQILRSLPYDCFVAESVRDDESLREYRFAYGPPHRRQRTLLQSNEFFHLLDELQQQAYPSKKIQSTLCTEAFASIGHTWLASCAASWLLSDKSLVVVLDAARQLAALLDVPIVPEVVMVEALSSRVSVVQMQNTQLLIERDVASHLAQDQNGKLFAYVLRDLLELLLTKKLFGNEVLPQQLTAQQRCDLLNCLTQIIDYGKPATVGTVMHAQAEAILADAKHFGCVQILPTIGAALGHAWIAPALSLIADTTRQSGETQASFMHTGFHLAPRECRIREWPTRFLSARENEHVFSAARAWHLPVPVETQRLQSAAEAIVSEWRERRLAYRFMGSYPAIDATGCRITVWQAVQRGMSADALTLFQHYNRGLPEPESPTELWLRLDGMMRWLEIITSTPPDSKAMPTSI